MRIVNLTKTLYNTSPATWVYELRVRLNNIFRSFEKTTGKIENEQIDSEHNIPLARRLDKAYFARRDPFLQSLIERIRAGEDLHDVLQGFNARDYEERTLEYPFFVNWLLKQKSGADLLDVGCVMNNKLVSKILRERCNYVWLCNISIEKPVFVMNPVFYHLARLEESFPGGERFPLVTCLSTIEHIGYDNSQYGCQDPPKYTEPVLEPLIEVSRKLAQLTACKGSLLISVPYGHREVVLHPVTGKIHQQTFDYSSMKKALAVLETEGISCKMEVFAAGEMGWKPVDPLTCNLHYAEGCPAASAVAIIEGEKRC